MQFKTLHSFLQVSGPLPLPLEVGLGEASPKGQEPAMQMLTRWGDLLLEAGGG